MSKGGPIEQDTIRLDRSPVRYVNRVRPQSVGRDHDRFDHAERLCVTLDTLRNGVPIAVSTDTISQPIQSLSNVS